MVDIHFPSDTCINEFLWANYGIQVKSITPLSDGADINAALYKVQGQDQASYFVKLKQGYEVDSNLDVVKLLHESGIAQIISPFKADCNCLIIPIIDYSLTVYPFIQGVNGFNRKLTKDQWILLGNALRRVHDYVVPSDILEDLKKETYSPKWRQMVRALLTSIDNEPTCNDDIAQKFVHFCKEHRSVIEHLVNRAEELGNIIKYQSTEFVLCHSYIHAGNVLIQDTGAIYIVDWDELIMAPKERDLMFIGGGVGNVWNDPQEEVLFYKGYGKTNINMTIMAYYRYERIVQDVAEYGQALLLASGVITKDRPDMYKHFIDMFEPQGVVDIAFKTDKKFNH